MQIATYTIDENEREERESKFNTVALNYKVIHIAQYQQRSSPMKKESTQRKLKNNIVSVSFHFQSRSHKNICFLVVIGSPHFLLRNTVCS